MINKYKLHVKLIIFLFLQPSWKKNTTNICLETLAYMCTHKHTKHSCTHRCSMSNNFPPSYLTDKFYLRTYSNFSNAGKFQNTFADVVEEYFFKHWNN